MSISPISGLGNALPQSTEIGSATGAQGAGGDFGKMISNGMESVNQQLNSASQISKEYLTQGKHDLHEVMIALDQADLSFRYMVQIRNKVLDAYNDVMRMQV